MIKHAFSSEYLNAQPKLNEIKQWDTHQPLKLNNETHAFPFLCEAHLQASNKPTRLDKILSLYLNYYF